MVYRFFTLFLAACTLYASQKGRSIDDLIATAIKNHPSIQMSRQIIAGANAQAEGAQWGYFPTPSVDFSQSAQRRGTTLRLDQPLWTGGKLDAAVDIATSKKNEALYTLDETGYLLVDNLLSTTQSYLMAQGNAIAIEEGKDQLTALNEMLERRIEAGVSAVADQELIKSRLAQIHVDLSSALIRRDMAHAQLELIIGSRVDTTILFQSDAFFHEEGATRQFIEEMIATHPSLKKLAAVIKTAEAERDRSKAALWPNVSLRAEHQNGLVYSDQATTSNLIYIAVQASPGAGLSALSSIQVSESNILRAQFEKMTKERELSDAVLRDYNDYRNAIDRVEGMNKSINASQKVFDSFTRLFVAGKRQWLDLVNTSRELTQNKIALSDLRATRVVSGYQLALKRGKMNLTVGSDQ